MIGGVVEEDAEERWEQQGEKAVDEEDSLVTYRLVELAFKFCLCLPCVRALRTT